MSIYYTYSHSLSSLLKLLRNSSLKYCSWHLLAAVVTLRCVVKASVMYTYNTVSCLLECNQATDSVDYRAKVCNTQWQQEFTSKGMPEMCSFIECSWLAVQWLRPDLTIIYTHTHTHKKKLLMAEKLSSCERWPNDSTNREDWALMEIEVVEKRRQLQETFLKPSVKGLQKLAVPKQNDTRVYKA